MQTVTIGTSVSTSTLVRVDDMAAAAVHVAGLSTAVSTLAVWAAASPESQYGPLVSSDG